ncbi:shK domain-like domain-containing protein [Ditylenchus destructor]|uniref:ShK domain-like domain-containing protein n=1 Tax=Ditylenchus destructor TaxID=166010 RepID=A0AAD4R6Q0_9BILA|nr:shK domain-like domain-containing protein [Ditylenchus destructor]
MRSINYWVFLLAILIVVIYQNESRSRRRSRRGRLPPCTDTEIACVLRAKECVSPHHYKEAERDCPKTCNRCGHHKPLVDIGDHCHRHKQRGKCKDAAHIDIMAWLCPKTCGFTHHTRPRHPRGRVGHPIHNDKDKLNCQWWTTPGPPHIPPGPDFCHNRWYNASSICEHCPEECALIVCDAYFARGTGF